MELKNSVEHAHAVQTMDYTKKLNEQGWPDICTRLADMLTDVHVTYNYKTGTLAYINGIDLTPVDLALWGIIDCGIGIMTGHQGEQMRVIWCETDDEILICTGRWYSVGAYMQFSSRMFALHPDAFLQVANHVTL